MKQTNLMFALLPVLLAACDPYPGTLRPDYTIHVVSTPKGDVAVPPECPSWNTEVSDPYDNQPWPQFGCAQARNLALSIERPSDLVQGRDLGPERGVHAVGSIRRYDASQTRGLIDPNTNADSAAAATTSSTAASALSGDITNGGGSSSSSGSSSSTSTGP